MEHKIHINCPNCDKENIIELNDDIKCKKCGESLITEKIYKTKIKPIIGAGSAIILGIGGGVYIDNHYFDTRYPLNVEYKIIRNCASYDMPYSKYQIKKATNICICALEKTEKNIDFEEFNKNNNTFLQHFQENIDKCIR